MCYWLCTLIVCLSVVSAVPPLGAQSAPVPSLPPVPPAQTFTIARAVQEALEKNLTLVAERYNINVAEARIITARLRPNPVLTLSGALPDHDIYHANINPYSEVAHLDWVFERGGKREARIAVAEQARSVAELQLLDTIRTLILDVENACVDVLVAKANLQLSQENLQSLNQVVEVNTHRVRAGDLAQVELQRTRLAALQFQNEVRKNETELIIARNKLRTLLGHPFAGSSVDVRDELRRDGTPPSADTVLQQAMTLRPDLQALTRDEARSAADLRLQIAQGKIDFTVGGEFQRQQSPTLSGNQFGISFSAPIPIFNRNQGEIERAQQERDQILAKLTALKHDITTEVENAYQTFTSTQAVIQNIEANMLEPAGDVRTTMEYSYRRGQATFVEFLDAQRAYNETRQSYNQVRGDYARNLYQLDAVSGLSERRDRRDPMNPDTQRLCALALQVLWLAGGVLLPTGAAAAWTGAQDNKSLPVLEQMFDFELASEGHTACLTATMVHFRAPARVPALSAQAHAYREKLGQVAQRRALHGDEVPAWVDQMHRAIAQQEPLLCHASWERVMTEHLNALTARHPRPLPGREPHNL